MALDYRKCAEEIFATLGGKDNIASAAHCATRLRLAIVDNGKVDLKKLENVEGVQGVFSNAGQLQIIIGTGTVNKVFDEFIDVSGVSAGSGVKAGASAGFGVDAGASVGFGASFAPSFEEGAAAQAARGSASARQSTSANPVLNRCFIRFFLLFSASVL